MSIVAPVTRRLCRYMFILTFRRCNYTLLASVTVRLVTNRLVNIPQEENSVRLWGCGLVPVPFGGGPAPLSSVTAQSRTNKQNLAGHHDRRAFRLLPVRRWRGQDRAAKVAGRPVSCSYVGSCGAQMTTKRTGTSCCPFRHMFACVHWHLVLRTEPFNMCLKAYH